MYIITLRNRVRGIYTFIFAIIYVTKKPLCCTAFIFTNHTEHFTAFRQYNVTIRLSSHCEEWVIHKNNSLNKSSAELQYSNTLCLCACARERALVCVRVGSLFVRYTTMQRTGSFTDCEAFDEHHKLHSAFCKNKS